MENLQKNNPLHGITLENIINDLVFYFDWDTLGELIHIQCFRENPSVKSSLVFLRKTPWAREKVERLYLKYFKRIEAKKKLSHF
ncbi:MAG: VF530 family DNA-binding protein [Bacteroidales bacterium]